MRPPVEKVLIFAAEPTDAARLQLTEEIKAIQTALGLPSSVRDRWDVKQCHKTQSEDLQPETLLHNPLVVHFCGHGAGRDGQMFEDNQSRQQLVSVDGLAGYLKLFRDQVVCVVFNTCLSEAQAAAVAEHIPYVIGMKQEIGDRAAINFSRGFYTALFAGKEVKEALDFGVSAIQLGEKAGGPARNASTGGKPHTPTLPEHQKPVLLGRGGPLPPNWPRTPRVQDLTPDGRSSNHDAVVAFNVHFQKRKEGLASLKMYKTLHDILHEVRDNQEGIVRAAEGRTYSPAADVERTRNELSEWLKRGRMVLAETPRTVHRPTWFAEFEAAALFVLSGLGSAIDPGELATATAVLAELDGEPPTLPRAAERLCNLPSRKQEPLNDDLIRTAKDLNAAELLTLLDQLLARLSDDALLRKYGKTFRDRCRTMSVLMDNHTHCQKIDWTVWGVVGAADGLRQRRLTGKQWEKVCDELGRVAIDPPGGEEFNKAAFLHRDIALTSARGCTVAATDPAKSPPLEPFREAFKKLFYATDKELIELIKDVVSTAEMLDNLLTRHLK